MTPRTKPGYEKQKKQNSDFNTIPSLCSWRFEIRDQRIFFFLWSMCGQDGENMAENTNLKS